MKTDERRDAGTKKGEFSCRLHQGMTRMRISRKLFCIRAVFIVPSLTIGTAASAAQKIETGFLNRSITFKGAEYRYVVYVPREFSRSKTYPVILALHGCNTPSFPASHTTPGTRPTRAQSFSSDC